MKLPQEWAKVPVYGRAFISAIAFVLFGALLGGVVGYDGVGALVGLAAYITLVVKSGRVI